MPDLATDNSAVTMTDNGATVVQPVVNTNETGDTSGQVPEATPASELFKGVNPNQLPPEARAAYDSMLRDYREKTGKLSETIKSETAKAIEAYRQKAEFYDQIAAQEEFVKQWNEFVQKAQNPATPQAALDPALAQMKAQLQEMNQKIQQSEIAQITEAFAEAVDEKGAKLHPEFNQLNSLVIGEIQNGQEAEEFSLLRACVELAKGSPQEKLANGYKAAKALRDAIFEEGKKAGMGRLQTKALNGTLPPSNATGEVLSVTEKKPRNAREALELAKKGIVVSRD